MSTCRSCQQEIIWAKTVTGKSMPIERADDGNLIVVKGIAHVIPKGEEPVADMQRFVSHFATCPKAELHRRIQARKKAVANA